MAKKRKKKRNGKKKIILFVFEILLLLVVLGVLAIYNSTLGRINYKDKLTDSQAGINDDLHEETKKTMHGYLNIALFGLDTRDPGDYKSSNSDCIMVASLNYDTNDVQLVSVYRDTYLSVGNGKYFKANSAFARGGVEQAVKMLNSNLDLNITKYVCVDWKALIEVIDKLGGIDLNLTSEEVKYVNFYVGETAGTTGNSADYLKGSGSLHLNGVQATSYARIRYTAGDDYMRASRQRIVLQAILDKAKGEDIATLTSMCTAVMDDISTNFSATEILGLAKDVTSYNIANTTGFPFELTTKIMSGLGDTVIPIDLANNVDQLHKFLFKDEAYEVSDTVQSISKRIEDKTGVSSKSEAVNTSKYNNTVGVDGTTSMKEKNKTTTEQTNQNDSSDSESTNSNSNSNKKTSKY